MFAPNREEIAWAAGFFDGEGFVGVTHRRGKKRAPVITVAITQVDRRVLDRFAAAVGVGKVYGPGKSYHGWRPKYSFHASQHPRVQAICAMLWQWLSPVKREQFRDTLLKRMQPSFLNRRCEHDKYPSLCRECLREPNKLNMRRWRLIRKTAHALLVAV